MEPIPGSEREGSFDPDEEIPPQLQDDLTEGDPDLADEQRTAKPHKPPSKIRIKESIDLPKFEQPKGLNRMLNKEFERQLAARMKLFKCDALDALHDMATMKCDNAAMMQMKYLAACRLLQGDNIEGARPSNMDDLMQRLKSDFRENAPRIKSIRERTVTFEDDAPKLVN